MKIVDKVAWIQLSRGRVLSTRSRGKKVWYLPGGKREPGETDIQTLAREIREELSVCIDVATAQFLGVFEAQADGHAEGVLVRMTCYTASYSGDLVPAAEIEEFAWLSYEDREKSSRVDQTIFDELKQRGLLLSAQRKP